MELKNRHVRRLREGTCTIEQGFILSDVLTSLERIADHCSNIAVCVSQVAEDSFDTHSYLNAMKKEENEDLSAQNGRDKEAVFSAVRRCKRGIPRRSRIQR